MSSNNEAAIFILQCLQCGTIVGDSSELSGGDDASDVRSHHVRRACNVRSGEQHASKLHCSHCSRCVGQRHADWVHIERAAVRKVVFSTPPPGAVRGVPSEGLEAVLLTQQRQLKVAVVELSKKTAAIANRVATVDAKAGVQRQQQQLNDHDDNDNNDKQ